MRAQLINKMCPWQGTVVFLQHRVFDCMIAMTSRYGRHRLHYSPYVLLSYSSVLACTPLINKNESQLSKAHGTSSSLEIHKVRKPRNQALSHRHEYFTFVNRFKRGSSDTGMCTSCMRKLIKLHRRQEVKAGSLSFGARY
jgi:hypothetical protein